MSKIATRSTKPAAGYVGGKSRLAGVICQKIGSVPHKSYVEPFCGMGGIFFRRDHKVPCEVIYDVSGEIINFFRILQRHYEAFEALLSYTLPSRAEFDRLKKVSPDTLTDLERAVRFFYLQRLSFGGRVRHRSFGVSPGSAAGYNARKLTANLKALQERLSGVVIENLQYKECLERYDRVKTLFYLDPPYWNSEDYYGKGLFDKTDFTTLAEELLWIRGQFLLSINDTPEIRKIFKHHNIEEVKTTYSIAKNASKKAGELLISNF